ncbi:MAG TPA: DUF3365 domain-containing protein [Nitrospira sp.]|nr:DUF3365 domain-containing protein [Nitrospira sp.]
MCFALSTSASSTGEPREATDAARLVALLLDAGRVTIARNQDLINDPTKGDKGFTPEVFETQLEAEFRQRTGLSLARLDQAGEISPLAKSLLGKLLEESKNTIGAHQIVINIPGVRYKGLNPATFATETAERFQRWSGVYLKQTAPSSFVRNPKNAPDSYEVDALARMAATTQSDSTTIISDVVEGGQAVRVLLPLFYDKSCLACHGEPKGERDISGYPKEGAKEGQLGGAISVKIPLK